MQNWVSNLIYGTSMTIDLHAHNIEPMEGVLLSSDV
jgi:hypothetical protein